MTKERRRCCESCEGGEHLSTSTQTALLRKLDEVQSTSIVMDASEREGCEKFKADRQDANDTLKFMGRESANGPGYITENLESIVFLRTSLLSNKLSGKQKTKSEEHLSTLYYLLLDLAENADPQVFEEVLEPASPSSRNQLLEYWQHVESALKILSKDHQWKTTGKIKRYDQRMLASMTGYSMHKSACRLLWDKTTLLKTMAIFLGNSDNPPVETREAFLITLINLKTAMTRTLGLSLDDVYKQYVDTGVLGQALRCCAYTVANHSTRGIIDHVGHFLDDLMRSSEIIRKNLKPGTPTRDILATLVARKDIYPSIHNRLQNLHRLAIHAAKSSVDSSRNKSCSNCMKLDLSKEFQESLKACQACKTVYYCNRECQKADWKSHKKYCKPADKKSKQSSKGAGDCTMSFLYTHYNQVMMSIVNTMKTHNCKKQDIVVALDFLADESGVAPSLKSPPEFLCTTISEITRKPHWCYRGNSKQEMETRRAILKQQAEKCGTNQLVVTYRWSDGTTAVLYVQCLVSKTQKPMFSTEAVTAYSSLEKGDCSLLSSHLGAKVTCQYTTKEELPLS